MADRERTIRGLECCARFADSMEFFSKACWDCPYNDNMFSGTCSTVKPLLTDALALLRDQEPHLLGLEEVKAIALREATRILSTEVEPVWLEQNEGGITNLSLVLISWWYMEYIDEDESAFEFIAKYFGTDIDETLKYLDYGTRWRVWSSKPTIEQRKAAKWNG